MKLFVWRGMVVDEILMNHQSLDVFSNISNNILERDKTRENTTFGYLRKQETNQQTLRTNQSVPLTFLIERYIDLDFEKQPPTERENSQFFLHQFQLVEGHVKTTPDMYCIFWLAGCLYLFLILCVDFPLGLIKLFNILILKSGQLDLCNPIPSRQTLLLLEI